MHRVKGLHILRSVAQLADGGAHAAQALVHAGRQGLVVEQLPERLAAIELAAVSLALVKSLALDLSKLLANACLTGRHTVKLFRKSIFG